MTRDYQLPTSAPSPLPPGAPSRPKVQTQEAAGLTPALVIVHTPRWMPYGALLELASPDLTSPFIFAIGIGPKTDAALAAEFPERRILHYYPEEPWIFYLGRRTP